MIRFKLHHHLPLIGRPFLQRDQARLERDRADLEAAQARLGRDQAGLERDQALKERDQLQNALRAMNTLYVPPGHFFSPVVDPVEADRHISRMEANQIPLSLDGIKIDREEMIERWNSLLPFLNNIPFSQFKAPGFRYAFENPSYSWGDGSILYAMLRSQQPRRLIAYRGGQRLVIGVCARHSGAIF